MHILVFKKEVIIEKYFFASLHHFLTWNGRMEGSAPSLCQFLERPQAHCDIYHCPNSFWWFGTPPPLKNASYALDEVILH